MRRLTVLSGPGAPLGLRARSWLRAQAPFLPVDVADPASPRVRARWPGLPSPTAFDDLAVLDDEGALWRGDAAWLLLLWALRRHRREALALAALGRTGEARARVTSHVASEGEAGSGPCGTIARAIGALLALLGVLWGLLAISVWSPWALAACAALILAIRFGAKALCAIVPAAVIAFLAPEAAGTVVLLSLLLGVPLAALWLATRGPTLVDRGRRGARGPHGS